MSPEFKAWFMEQRTSYEAKLMTKEEFEQRVLKKFMEVIQEDFNEFVLNHFI